MRKDVVSAAPRKAAVTVLRWVIVTLLLGSTSAFAQLPLSKEFAGALHTDESASLESLPNNDSPCKGVDLSVVDNLHACIDYLVNAEVIAPEGWHGAAGAVVAVVKDDLTILRSYRCADVASTVSPDPERTMFRIGSVSKLITTTALMKLIADKGFGEGDAADILASPASRYLGSDFELPASFGAITLSNLLTHTSGVDERQIGIVEREPGKARTLVEYLQAYLPKAVQPPLDLDVCRSTNGCAHGVAYSNWAMALVGHIIATRASLAAGRPVSFAEYVDEKVFVPLKMTRSTFTEPAVKHTDPRWATEWSGRLAKGHIYRLGATQAGESETTSGVARECSTAAKLSFDTRETFDEYVGGAGPAMSMSATADDMSKFMRAHLDAYAKTYSETIGKRSAELMYGSHVTRHRHHDFNSGLLGFYESHWRQKRLLTHSGAVVSFASKVTLVPEAKLGVFIAVNSPTPDIYLENFTNMFIQNFLEKKTAGLPPVSPMGGYEGQYWLNFEPSTDEKIFYFKEPKFTVTVAPYSGGCDVQIGGAGGAIVTENLLGKVEAWKMIDRDLFRHVACRANGTWGPSWELLAFERNDRDEVIRLVGPSPFIDTARKIQRHETPAYHANLFKLELASFSALLLWWGVAGRSSGMQPGPTWGGRVAALLAAGNIVVLSYILSDRFPTHDQALYGYPGEVTWALRWVLVSVVLTGAVVVFSVLGFTKNYWDKKGRGVYSAFAVMAVAFLWSMYFWNLISIRGALT